MRTKYILLIIAILFIVLTPSQAQQEQTALYPNGNIRYKGLFKEGKPVGELIRYYPSGKINAKMDHKGDTVHAVLYGESEGFSCKGIYIKHMKVGVWTYYKNDKLLVEETYQENSLNGPTKRYNYQGQLFEEKNWKNGIPHGGWELYHPNGQLRMKVDFSYGKLEGTLLAYDQEGMLRTLGHYIKGLKAETWNFFDSTGKSIKTQDYYAGKTEEQVEEILQIDLLVNKGKRILDPEDFIYEPETYMKLTGIQ